MEQRLSIITLGANDLQAMTNFYTDTFGWQKSEMSTENISFFNLNGTLLGIYGKEALAEDATVDHLGHGFKGFTLAYLAKSEKEVDEIFETLDSKGAKIIKKPHHVFWGGYSGYISDVEDNLWEIAYNPFLSLDEIGNLI